MPTANREFRGSRKDEENKEKARIRKNTITHRCSVGHSRSNLHVSLPIQDFIRLVRGSWQSQKSTMRKTPYRAPPSVATQVRKGTSKGGSSKVDCKTVVDGVRSGHHWSFSSKRRYHQHWVTIFQALEAGESAERVVWVPAHVSEARIGEVWCGDGTPITKDMWLGNKLVDELAKRGAHATKAPQDVARRVVARQLQAQELAIFVGQCPCQRMSWGGRQDPT